METKIQKQTLCGLFVNACNFKRYALSFILFVTALTMQAQVRVVDSESGEPVDVASVFDNATGKFIGLTDADGNLPSAAEKCSSISLQHINYKTCDAVLNLVDGKQIKMTPYSREIKDVKVSKDPKAKIRLKVAVRTYVYTNGQVAMVTEELCNLYFKNSKSKMIPRYVSMARTSYADAAILKSQSRFIRMLAQIGDPTGMCDYNLCQDYDKLLNGARLPSAWKREGGVTYMNEDSVNKRCEIILDSTFFKKPFTIWPFPISFANVYTSETYSLANGKPQLYDMQNKLNMYRIIRKKTGEFVDYGVEMYVYGIDYATKDDVKSDKQMPLTEFYLPEGLELPDMNPNIKRAMGRMTKFRHIDEILGEDDTLNKDAKDEGTSGEAED